MQDITTELPELLRQQDFLRAAFAVGRIQDPDFDPKPFMDTLKKKAVQIHARMPKGRRDITVVVRHVADALFGDLGLHGKRDSLKVLIDDPNQYYLHLVLQKRVGAPLAVFLLFGLMLEQLGVSFECLALPSQFILRIRQAKSNIYVDPFEPGRFLTEEEFHRKFRTVMHRYRLFQGNLFEKVGLSQLISKLVQQLKQIYILKGQAVEALRSVEILKQLFPHSPELTRDRGVLYCEIECFSKAIEDLRSYLKQRPDAEDVPEIKKLTSMIRGYREIVN